MTPRAPTSLRDPLPDLPKELAGHSIYRASSDGVDENLLVLLHGLGDTAGAALLGLGINSDAKTHAPLLFEQMVWHMRRTPLI